MGSGYPWIECRSSMLLTANDTVSQSCAADESMSRGEVVGAGCRSRHQNLLVITDARNGAICCGADGDLVSFAK